MTNRPDFSNYLVHFTSNGDPKGGIDDNPIADVAHLSAMDRLVNILRDKKVRPSKMPWTHANAVCFTECPWSSLLAHAGHYSPFGIGFSKKSIFAKHGGPAIYIRPDHFEKQRGRGYTDHLWPFLTPFSPLYRPYHMKQAAYDKGTCDYSHEREWRVPHEFPFEYNQVEFIILNTYKDMAAFPQDLKDAIGREKFILMDNYRLIEKLWPVHNL
jgi:hypothetical protein